MKWYDPIAPLEGLGTRTPPAATLAALHTARLEHGGQFFTPARVARLMWDLIEPVLTLRKDRLIRLFDNSVGTGRLFQFADPERHTLCGVDIDGGSVGALAKAAEAAEFDCDLVTASMTDIRPRPGAYDVGLINPPYSLTLTSPHLEAYSCTHWGPYGRNSRTLSHAYALEQALDACQIVVAILPRGYAREAAADESLNGRLLALLHLPGDAFATSGTYEPTTLAVFDRRERRSLRLIDRFVGWGEGLPELSLHLPRRLPEHQSLRLHSIEPTEPTIRLPVTGNRRVHVAHDARKLVLTFSCGLMQAKVMNALLVGPVTRDPECPHRYPRELRYEGQCKLDLEAYLVQPHPQNSLHDLLREIRVAGGDPVVDPGVWGYLRRRERALARSREPFRRWVRQDFGQDENTLLVRPRRPIPIDPQHWGSPVLLPSQTYCARRLRDTAKEIFEVRCAEYSRSWDTEELRERFIIESQYKLLAPSPNGQPEWVLLHPGKAAKFPQIAASLRAQARAQGLETWLSWTYQWDDLIEVGLNPRGAIVGWQPGMGKARLALALAYLFSGKHTLIVLEAGLVAEFLIELQLLNLDPQIYQVIEHRAQLETLRRVNIISYERLRSPVSAGAGRRTWARRLRRRCSTVIADEGEHLSNHQTAQSRALTLLSPKRRYVLTGSPIANYPRGLLPIIAWAVGEGLAAQPYGTRRAYLTPNLRFSANFAPRGIDMFRKSFVVTEWVTHEFLDQLSKGAKREVPKLRELGPFRQFHAPHLLRRVLSEPECAAYLPVPVPKRIVHEIDWDEGHFIHYLTVAEEFATWYYKHFIDSGLRATHLVEVLARLQAVFAACNQPHSPGKDHQAYTPLTSKQRFVLGRLKQLTAQGHKWILYARSPALLRRLSGELKREGIAAVVFDGTSSARERTQRLDRDFRFGPVPGLLASFGVTQKGLNIPQADRVLFYNREWTAKTEDQAGRRVLRPQQTHDVEFEYCHLIGSIDGYMAQMTAFKQDVCDSGLDWQSAQLYWREFVHLDTILVKFCRELAELRGIPVAHLREALAQRTAA